MSHFNIFHMVKPLMVVPFHVYPMVNQSPIHMVNQKHMYQPFGAHVQS